MPTTGEAMDQQLFIATLALSLTTNGVATAAIAYKAWYVVPACFNSSQTMTGNIGLP
jgi:hypothetical protein